MEALQDLLSGENRAQYDDFIKRYDDGPPWTGISDQEAAERYERVAPRLSREQYEQSAAAAFSRLTPEQCAEFGLWLASRSAHRGISFGTSDDYYDANRLAEYTSQVREEQPELLGHLVAGLVDGGGSAHAGFLSTPIAKGAIGGIAAMAVSQSDERSQSAGGLRPKERQDREY